MSQATSNGGKEDRPYISRLLDKTIYAGLLSAVALTVLAHGAVEPWSVGLFESLVVALLLLWAIKATVDKCLEVKIPTIALPVAALFLVGLAQSITVDRGGAGRFTLSRDVEATRVTVTTLFFLLASFIVAANFLSSRERLRGLAKFMVVFGVAIALFALLQHVTWGNRFYWVRPTSQGSPFGPFVNRNHFAGYMEMLIPFPVALLMRGGRTQDRLLYLFSAAVMGTAAIASLSRGGMISLGASFILMAAVNTRLAKSDPEKSNGGDERRFGGVFGATGAVLLILASIAIGVVWIGAEPVINRAVRTVGEATGAEQQTNYLSRAWIWRDTLAMIRDNIVTGVGLGAFQTAYPAYAHSNGEIIVGEAHNDYLQILADCGLIGGALALWFLVLAYRAVARGLRSREPLLSGVALAAGSGIFGILVHSLFDFNLQLPSNALLFLLLAAVASHIPALAKERSRRARLKRSARETAMVSQVRTL